jgi:hypothetical protein
VSSGYISLFWSLKISESREKQQSVAPSPSLLLPLSSRYISRYVCVFVQTWTGTGHHHPLIFFLIPPSSSRIKSNRAWGPHLAGGAEFGVNNSQFQTHFQPSPHPQTDNKSRKSTLESHIGLLVGAPAVVVSPTS